MAVRNTQHSTFVIERTFDASPARVFAAFAQKKFKDLWFGGPKEWTKTRDEFDFRIGGRERLDGGPAGGVSHKFDCHYWDIVPNERIIYSYEMHLDDKKISVSQTTIEIKPASKGTRLVFTEQGVFLDGYDDAGSREEGSNWLLNKLGESLKVSAPA